MRKYLPMCLCVLSISSVMAWPLIATAAGIPLDEPVPIPAAVVDSPWWVDLLAVVGSLLGSMLLWAGKKLVDWLTEQNKRAWLGRLAELAVRIVVDLYNTMVEAAKDAAADGKLTQAERDRFKRLAVDRLRSWIGPKGLKAIVWAAGANPESLDQILAAEIESAVTVAKNAGKAARGPLLPIG